MSYRFTNTEKWSDSWFTNLEQIQMLLFIYLCDNCDIAGFIEVNYKRWAVDLGSSPSTIEGACKGLARGLLASKEGDCFYVRNFLKHQKNIPLNENNKAHVGILKRFCVYANKFDIQDVNEFIEGASKGLPSPTGIGIGIGIGKEESVRETKNGKVAYAPNVHLTEKEYEDLKGKYSQDGISWMIEKLSSYKEAKGKTYKSDAGAIRSWVVDEYAKRPVIRKPQFVP